MVASAQDIYVAAYLYVNIVEYIDEQGVIAVEG